MSSTTSASGRSRARRSSAFRTDQKISSGAPAAERVGELVLGARLAEDLDAAASR